jgi:hypothetical protein
MRKRSLICLGTAVAAAAATLVGTAPAFAAGSTDVLSYGGADPNGTNVALTDTLHGALVPGTSTVFKFTTSAGSATITCTASTETAKATANPAKPGTAKLSLSVLTFSDGGTSPCTITGVTGVNSVVSIKLKSAASAIVTDGTTKHFTITHLNQVVTLNTLLGNITCDYGTTTVVKTIRGTVTNPNASGTGGSIKFTNATVGLISGSSLCGSTGSTGTFNADFGSITDGSGTGTNRAVYDN